MAIEQTFSRQSSNVNIENIWETSSPKPLRSKEKLQVPQLGVQLAETYLESHQQLYVTLEIKGHDKFRIKSSPCLQEALDDILSFECVNNFINVAQSQQQQTGSARNAIEQDQIPGFRQFIEDFGADHSPLIKQTTKKRQHSPYGPSSLSKKSRPFSELDLEFIESELSENDEYVETEDQSKSIRIGDSTAVNQAYRAIFEVLQQLSCKQIAKAWIKAIEPEKQSRFPYNGGKNKETAIRLYGKENQGCLTLPEWWPPTGCPHTEPDHIKKKERLILMLHIIRNPDISWKDLEASTNQWMKTQSRFIKSLLDEIYYIRRHEDALAKGEIDSNTMMNVLDHAKSSSSKPRKSGKKKTEVLTDADRRPSISASERTRVASIDSQILSSLVPGTDPQIPERRYVQENSGLKPSSLSADIADQSRLLAADTQSPCQMRSGILIDHDSTLESDAPNVQTPPESAEEGFKQTDLVNQSRILSQDAQLPCQMRRGTSTTHGRTLGSDAPNGQMPLERVGGDFMQTNIADQLSFVPAGAHPQYQMRSGILTDHDRSLWSNVPNGPTTLESVKGANRNDNFLNYVYAGPDKSVFCKPNPHRVKVKGPSSLRCDREIPRMYSRTPSQFGLPAPVGLQQDGLPVMYHQQPFYPPTSAFANSPPAFSMKETLMPSQNFTHDTRFYKNIQYSGERSDGGIIFHSS